MSPSSRARNDAAWRILDLSGYSGSVRCHEHVLEVERPDTATEQVALADVATIMLGPDVSLAAGTVLAIMAHHILVLWCDWRGVPHAATHPWSSNTRVTTRQRAQAALGNRRADAAWARIVRAKIEGQARTLRACGRQGAPTLERLAAGRIRHGDPANIEGQAAAHYFPQLAQDATFTRGDSSRPLNAALNYGYGVVRAQIIRSILAAGLHPPLALHHKNRSNYFALADDLIEPFRPVVDFHAVRALEELRWDASERLPADVRHALVAVLRSPYTPGGYTVATEADLLAGRLAAYVEESSDTFPISVWEPPDA